jgi:hypothetical protein
MFPLGRSGDWVVFITVCVRDRRNTFSFDRFGCVLIRNSLSGSDALRPAGWFLGRNHPWSGVRAVPITMRR